MVNPTVVYHKASCLQYVHGYVAVYAYHIDDMSRSINYGFEVKGTSCIL